MSDLQNTTHILPIFIAFGTTAGIIIGSTQDNIGVWLSIGIGTAFGLVYQSMINSNATEESEQSES